MIDSDKELEEMVLGAAIMNDMACVEMIEILKIADVFTDQDCRTCFKAILSLFSKSMKVDIMSVANEASELKLAAKNDLYLFLVRCTSKVSGTSRQEQDCLYLKHFYTQRRVAMAGLEIQQLSGNAALKGLELISFAREKLDKIDSDIEVERIKTLNEVLDESIEDVKQIGLGNKSFGHSVGLYEVDRVLGGAQDGSLIIIAARPSMGKTALALKISHSIASKVGSIAFFSIEMTESELVKRLIASNIEGLDMPKMFMKGVKQEDYNLLEQAKKTIGDLPIIIESKSFSLTEMVYKIKKYKTQKNIKAVFIDYLQLMSGFEGKNYGSGSSAETAKISDITRTLKQVAKSLDIPIILLSQLNRSVEARPDKRPQLSDLRQSGSIEEDANCVMLLYRPEFYEIEHLQDGSSSEGVCEVIIPKNRSGKTGSVFVQYVGNKTAFYDIDSEPSDMPFSKNFDHDEMPF